MRTLTTEEEESFEYIFKTNNPHVQNIKGYLSNCLDDHVNLMIASGTENHEMIRTAGAASVLKDILSKINY